MFIFEWGKPFQWKPGIFKGTIKDKKFTRIWGAYLAIAWIDLSLKEYHEQLSLGITKWRKNGIYSVTGRI